MNISVEEWQNHLPELPRKERVVEMLNKVHAPGVPNWTVKEQYEMYIALRALALSCFRTEDVLTDI